MSIIVNVSWVDKRHITLRSSSYVHGAKCLHMANETEAQEWVNGFLSDAGSKGYKIIHVADRDWRLVK